MSGIKVVWVFRTLADGSDAGPLGSAVRYPEGWRFIPAVFGRQPSRRFWPTWEAALPRWIDYPDSCRTEAF